MKTAKIGLIGCGSRLRSVVKQVLKAASGIEVSAIFDPDTLACQKTKDLFNPKAKVYENYKDLLKNQEIDWVFIGSWNCFHAEQTIAAFEAGKNVFCEKPLALTVDDCLAMRNAWQASKKLFTIGFTLRYSPHYQQIKKIISSGEIGRILSFEFNETLDFNHGGFIHADWRRKTAWAGSHLLEKCCHDIDLANWIINSTAIKTASFGGCDFFTPENSYQIQKVGQDENGIDGFQTWQKKKGGNTDIPGNITNPFNNDKDIVDNQVAILQYANGVRATFHTNCLSAIPERRMYICGSEGTLRADVLTGAIEVRKVGFKTETQNRSTNASGGHGGGDSILGESIANSILKNTAPISSLDDGLRAAITAFGVDEALKSGQVHDLTPMWQKAGILN